MGKIRTVGNLTKKSILHLILGIIPSFILVQSLFFKLSISVVNVKWFSTVSFELYERKGIRIAERIVDLLMLSSKTTVYGMKGAIGLKVGAVHYLFTTPLGMAISLGNGNTYRGPLFITSRVALILSTINAIIHRSNLPLPIFSK